MITDYQIVYGHDTWALQTKVKELLAKGWQPSDQLQMAMPIQDDKITPCFAQVMVKADKIRY